MTDHEKALNAAEDLVLYYEYQLSVAKATLSSLRAVARTGATIEELPPPKKLAEADLTGTTLKDSDVLTVTTKITLD